MKRWFLGIFLVLVSVTLYDSQDVAIGEESRQGVSAIAHSGAAVAFELWQWGGEPASQKKLLDLKDGAKLPGESLPWEGVQFRFRVAVPHDRVSCEGRSDTNFEKVAWGPEPVQRENSSKSLYRLRPSATVPASGKYSLSVEAKDHDVVVARSTVTFEIVRPQKPRSEGMLKVGMVRPFPKSMHAGGPVEIVLWQWDDADRAKQKELTRLEDGQKLFRSKLPKVGMSFRFRVLVPHDTVECVGYSTDCFDKIGWGPEKTGTEPFEKRTYRFNQLGYNFQVGKYCLAVTAKQDGKKVAERSIQFEIVDDVPPPCNTHYLKGKKDGRGNEITCSEPVERVKLNETPDLRDNDYAFEPQQAYNVVNFERFPPFQMPPRFVNVWSSRRSSDDDQFGGPLNRGFNVLCGLHVEHDNVPIRQRNWFNYPGGLTATIDSWYKKDPKQYADLKAWADMRSPFVSHEHAYRLQYEIFGSWGIAGYGGYSPGLLGWDEEEMWSTLGIGSRVVKERPELVPQVLRDLAKKDPELKSPEAAARINYEYTRAWGDFIGYGYRGARAAAAERGCDIKVWHYGSKAPGEALYMWNQQDYAINPATGKYRCEEPEGLGDWFKLDGRVNFEASEYARQIDYFHKDFYFHTLFPHKESLYVKTPEGKYVLDEKGRRKFRTDIYEEKVYADRVKLGYDDAPTSANFLKGFIAKGENALYWFNGAKYYKRHGTAITDKQLIPAMRPANQGTWNETAKFGDRPISPYMAEAAAIFTYMMGLEGIYLWDEGRTFAPAGQGRADKPNDFNAFGDLEFLVKGVHRVSQFGKLFEGDYSFVRPFCHYEFDNRDHPLIRGIINGRYLVLALTNPYLDPGETQAVELWYDAPYEEKTKVWSGQVTLESRKTRLVQCKLPSLPDGKSYDPDRLYFRYATEDGKYNQTYTRTGNYTVKYPYPK